jgi:hypothetical protein
MGLIVENRLPIVVIAFLVGTGKNYSKADEQRLFWALLGNAAILYLP